MRCADVVREVRASAAVRVAPGTVRSHRNESGEDVEMWAISKQLGRPDATKVDDFWEVSESAPDPEVTGLPRPGQITRFP